MKLRIKNRGSMYKGARAYGARSETYGLRSEHLWIDERERMD